MISFITKLPFVGAETENVVFDLKAVNRIDLSGLHMLVALQKKLKKMDIKLTFACGKGVVRDTLARWTAATKHGNFPHFETIDKALTVIVKKEEDKDEENGKKPSIDAKKSLLQEDELIKRSTTTGLLDGDDEVINSTTTGAIAVVVKNDEEEVTKEGEEDGADKDEK